MSLPGAAVLFKRQSHETQHAARSARRGSAARSTGLTSTASPRIIYVLLPSATPYMKASTLLYVAILGLALALVRHELQAAGGEASGGEDDAVAGEAKVVPVADIPEAEGLRVVSLGGIKARRVEIEEMLQTEDGGGVVILKLAKGDISGNRFLSIFVGTNEALAIARHRYKVSPPRPMTHDLLSGVIDKLGGKVERVTVTKIADSVYYAAITVTVRGKTIHLDARSSDSIALAVRQGAKIYVSEEVMREAGQPEAVPASDARADNFI
jgi:bifunctional DNase/RNase